MSCPGTVGVCVLLPFGDRYKLSQSRFLPGLGMVALYCYCNAVERMPAGLSRPGESLAT